ncbi:MAG: DUF1592 domain-containing protein [Gemmataceae bacterium]
MKTIKLVLPYLIVCAAANVLAQDGSLTLESAREQGRLRSQYLKEINPTPNPAGGIPKANIEGFQKQVKQILTQSCQNCHGPKTSKASLRIDQLNPDLLAGPDVERWREIYNALAKSEMPPVNDKNNKLTDNHRTAVLDWLREELDKASLVRRNSTEHSSFRRLTKYEYDYALQDLLGVPFSLAERLPPETATEEGFKNSSELLQITASQFEIYREIALKALKRATVTGERPKPVTYKLAMREEMAKFAKAKGAVAFDKNTNGYNKHKDQQHLWNRETGKGVDTSKLKWSPLPNSVAEPNPTASPVVLSMPEGNKLELNLDRFLPDEGVMRVRIRAARSNANPDEYASLRLSLSAHTSNNANFSQIISQRDIPVTAAIDKPQWIVFDIPLENIQRNPFRKNTTAFPRRDEFLTIHNVSNAKRGDEHLKVLIDHIEISAPHYDQWPPKTHTQIFFESSNKRDEKLYGREVLSTFLRRVFRRPATSQEVDRYLALFFKHRREFSTFEDAMVEVLATSLSSPEFLYVALRPGTDAKASRGKLSDFELATRLSLFLWSSIPDDELLKLAESGELRKAKVLESQVKRMLTDPRSKRFSRNFVEQWLGLDGLKGVTHISDGPLREAIQEEPIAFFEQVLTHNSSILDFIHCDYAVINESLATHYKIPKVYGPQFRKVPITSDIHRGGIVTSAAILAMNSDGKDSHPVKRGVWLLKHMLNDPPPPPPPDVPEVDLTNPKILQMTLKERIADHRNKAACASCHSRIDPWGIAFENYDALGVFRTEIKNKPVDATSELSNRQTLAGMDGLKRYVLLERQDQFARAMVHKVAAYALGRPLSFGDRAEIDQLTSRLRRRGDGLADLIYLMTSSDLFHSK